MEVMGALPLWTDFVKDILTIQEYKKDIDSLDLTILAKKEWPIQSYKSTNPFLVQLPLGLVIRKGSEADHEVWRKTNIAFTGESFDNPFSLRSSKLNSIVYLTSEFDEDSHEVKRDMRLYTPQQDQHNGRVLSLLKNLEANVSR